MLQHIPLDVGLHINGQDFQLLDQGVDAQFPLTLWPMVGWWMARLQGRGSLGSWPWVEGLIGGTGGGVVGWH